MSGLERPNALLLLGPTGSGKTPLGQLIEARGLGRVRCVHFDFGENLRSIVALDRPDATISRGDVDFLRGVVSSGALLEDEHFPLAERILRRFLDQHRVNDQTVVVLNGLPRHAGQADAIDAILNVRRVVYLECSTETIVQRLANNVGGDRGGRADDGLDQVRAKLDIFHRRTAPLVDHYRSKGVRIETITITSSTMADDALRALEINI
jgi:adenylate kinase